MPLHNNSLKSSPLALFFKLASSEVTLSTIPKGIICSCAPHDPVMEKKIVCQTLTSIGLNLRRATAFIELDEWGCQTLEMHVYSNRPRAAAVSLSWGPADAMMQARCGVYFHCEGQTANI